MSDEEVTDILFEVERELQGAIERFPKMASPHEGWAIIKEELDELWDEVKRQHDVRSNAHMRREAIQVAAMAVRFIKDVCYEDI